MTGLRKAWILLFGSLAAPVAAGELQLQLPIDCELGETCHIQQFVDHDPGPGARDYLCGSLSYEGHKGTDFALPFQTDMEAGVNVLAAADGVVRGMRDGVPDQVMTEANRASVANRECGNGVVLVHPDGWETQYCHMKRGSVTVRSGDKVSAGTVLGQVGLSGRTQFPHLHLSVRHEGKVVDPFAPERLNTCGDAPSETLWDTVPHHTPGGIIGGGFATTVPEFSDVKKGIAGQTSLAPTAPAIVYWSYAYGTREGDVWTLTLEGPNGRFSEYSDTMPRHQAQVFRATGRRLRGAAWRPGTYKGIATLTRDGQEYDRFESTIEIR